MKWADGLLHIDGAVTKSWFNGFGTLTLCCIREAHWGTAVFGWVGVGGVSSGCHFTLSSATRAVTGAVERDSDVEVAAEWCY